MNRKEEKQLHSRTIEEWIRLVERYFEATLSDDEERELYLFLASEASSSPIFDEVKAVTGYIATAKARRPNCQTPTARAGSRASTTSSMMRLVRKFPRI